jgi:hypothetical protein
MPLQARIDGKVQGTGAANVSLAIVPAETQTADLFQCQDISGNALFAIRLDGNIATAMSELGAVPANQSRRIPIFDRTNTLLGYVPIYSSNG